MLRLSGGLTATAAWLVIVMVLAAASMVSGASAGPPTMADAMQDAGPAPADQPPDGAGCTVVYAADESGAYGGSNEDERNPLTQIWFIPGEAGAHGSLFVGYDDLVVQGGMNEAGLFFDALGVREVDVPGTFGKPTYGGQNLTLDVMAECDSVACVIEQFRAFSMEGTWNGQLLFGDRFGASAIIEPLTVISKSDRFQVATNFFQSEVPPAERTDERYVTATSMLAAAGSVSSALVRDVLEATHQEGTVNTVYSTVYDLQAQSVDLYYFGDFSTAVTFDLADELAKGVHGYELTDLFPSNEAAARVAAPIRTRLSAALAGHEPVSVEKDRLADLTGRYEVGRGTELFVEASEGALRARLSAAPFVNLVPVSTNEFVRVFADGGGFVHEEGYRFTDDIWGRPQVEITDDQGGGTVGVRSDAPRFPFAPLLVVAVVLMAVVPGGVAWLASHRRHRGRRQHSSLAVGRFGVRSAERPSEATGGRMD